MCPRRARVKDSTAVEKHCLGKIMLKFQQRYGYNLVDSLTFFGKCEPNFPLGNISKLGYFSIQNIKHKSKLWRFDKAKNVSNVFARDNGPVY